MSTLPYRLRVYGLPIAQGRPRASRFGDDGEMSCGECCIDFKRQDPRSIAAGIRNHGMLRAAKEAKA